MRADIDALPIMHAPDEHISEKITREALQMMTGLFWDLSENKKTLFKE